MSYTLICEGPSSELEAHFRPALHCTGEWVVGLLNFECYNSIPNIETCKIRVGHDNITLPTGSYEIEDLNDFINKQLTKKQTFSLKGNNNTMTTEMTSSADVELTPELSLMLGFDRTSFKAGESYISKHLVNIFSVTSINVELNLAQGALINGKQSHSIHSFFPSTQPGFKLIESPQTVIYHPVQGETINFIQIRIVDQLGRLINFRGESVTVRLHLKKL